MRRRLWNIVLHVHADRMVTVRVHADTRLLLPICEGPSVEQALLYIEAVLSDCHPDDQLVLRAQDLRSVQMLRTTDSEAAKVWLRERALALVRAPGPPTEAMERQATGTVRIVPDEGGTSESSKRSAS